MAKNGMKSLIKSTLKTSKEPDSGHVKGSIRGNMMGSGSGYHPSNLGEIPLSKAPKLKSPLTPAKTGSGASKVEGPSAPKAKVKPA